MSILDIITDGHGMIRFVSRSYADISVIDPDLDTKCN